MQILLQYLKPYKWLVVLSLFLACINQTFSLLDPLIFGRIIDRFANHPHTTDKAGLESRGISQYLGGVALLLLASMGVAMVSRIAKAFQDYCVSVVIQKFGASIFTTGLQHSLKLPFQDFEDQRSGETLSILTKVRTDCEKFITNFINIFFSIVVGVVFVAVYAISIHWSVAPTYFVGILLLSWLTSLLSRKIKVIQKTIVQETTSLAGSTTESLRNIELVKSLGLSEQEIKRLNNNTYKILGLEIKKVKSIRTLSFIQGTFVNTLRQTILFLLMYLIFKDQLSVGQLFTMQLYSFFIFGPLQEIGNIILSYREAEASLHNFKTLMSKPVERMPSQPKDIGSLETLSFEDVTFRHQTAMYNALDSISFTAKKGETIAFVGPSGSGKSTLVKLLVGLYTPQQGKILYNNVENQDIHFDSLREQIGFVTQDTQLFAGTIRENLLFVRPDATDEELVDVLKQASCQYLLSRAEHGISTVIGEGGLKLSGGERQRLSIARSLLRHPRLLIFDEATSALDSITEEEITGTIKQISAQREQITVLIAHRLSTIMHADRIFVLEKGQMAETGSHESLLAEKGLYYAMWRQQIGERK
ncbi:ABC transporter ATP-binding protein [Filimonas effusa]|uniref:ABC transporter ATP-binding protein n=1 Tax=Filimonas effusa TaxID=2508721 RepID=A0A4Q1D1L0_9BACT|nr:ABC transporter ATP-binding protein [Filimonas effusa]RXK81701.1 ABC transporter ATP-binding protein [Filimonas effusa]